MSSRWPQSRSSVIGRGSGMFASQRIKTFLSSRLYVTHCCRCSRGSRAAGRVWQQVLTVVCVCVRACVYVCVLLTRHLQTLAYPSINKEPVRDTNRHIVGLLLISAADDWLVGSESNETHGTQQTQTETVRDVLLLAIQISRWHISEQM